MQYTTVTPKIKQPIKSPDESIRSIYLSIKYFLLFAGLILQKHFQVKHFLLKIILLYKKLYLNILSLQCYKFLIMKKVYLFLISVLSIVTLFTSCEKDHGVYDPDKVKHTSDLVVPKGFDWQMTGSANYSISAPVKTVASIFTDENCNEDQLIAQIPVSATPSAITLEYPASTQILYVQFPVQNGKKEVMPVTVNATRATQAIKLPEDAEYDVKSDDIYGDELIHYIRRGTVMFEDSWPVRGDYDFNDFVIYYDIASKISGGGRPDVYDHEGLDIKVQFRAIGGAYNYQLGLQLEGMPAKFIDSYDISQDQETVKVKFLNPNEEGPAVFVFEGTPALKGQNGAQFYNTEKGHAIDKNQLITATIKLNVNCYNNLPKNLALITSIATASHNFFLTADKEIHLRGYSPTAYYPNYEMDANGLMSSISYCDKDGFVWGIKVPADIKHAIEKTDFIEAYPKFGKWVSSSGTQNKDWYKHPVSGKVID